MKFERNNDVDMTWLQGEIDVSYYTLVDIFGPHHDDGDGHKVDAEWRLKFEDGTVATIYNYKTGYNYLGPEEGQPVEQIRDWHIGGDDLRALTLVKNAIEDYQLTTAEREYVIEVKVTGVQYREFIVEARTIEEAIEKAEDKARYQDWDLSLDFEGHPV